MFRELVDDADRAFGVDSEEVAIARNNLAAVEFQLGHAEEASRLFRRVLAAVADQPDQAGFAAGVRNNLATVLFGLEANLARVLAVEGDRVEAARMTRRCIAHYEARLPPSHPRIAELRGSWPG